MSERSAVDCAQQCSDDRSVEESVGCSVGGSNIVAYGEALRIAVRRSDWQSVPGADSGSLDCSIRNAHDDPFDDSDGRFFICSDCEADWQSVSGADGGSVFGSVCLSDARAVSEAVDVSQC